MQLDRDSFIYLVLALVLFGCTSQLTNRNEKYRFPSEGLDMPVAAGGISINDSLWCDRTEVTNIFWKEYLAHIKRVFGEESRKYQDAYPDTNGYILKVADDHRISSKLSRSDYFSNRLYHDYPVVGITLEQAKEYSKWRSDRVFESLLIRNKVIEYNRNQNAANHFTINGYLSSKIARRKRNRKLVTHYPLYFIPDLFHWELVKEKIEAKELLVGVINSYETAKIHQSNNQIPILPARDRRAPIVDRVLYNLFGNVAEMLNQENMAFGGSYEDQLTDILKMRKSKVETPSENVGFRNMGKWVKIEY